MVERLKLLRVCIAAALTGQMALAPAEDLPDPEQSSAYRALDNAVITDPARISARARAELGWLIDPMLARKAGAA